MDVDFLILGGGLAGLNAALLLAPYGSVLLVNKKTAAESATAYAQGGIASVTDSLDSFESHCEDTLAAGAGLCHRDVVERVVLEAPQAIEHLVELGVVFDKISDKQGSHFDLTREGGHSARRILHAKDTTGQEIVRALRARVCADARIMQWPHHMAVDLITTYKIGMTSEGGGYGVNQCLGAYVLDEKSGCVKTVRARATLLATGGAGKLYTYTSNPDIATGDGVAMAYRAGASIANMEFFQFHPTCLYHPQAKSFLISEALRGEGASLRCVRDGSSLMHDVHPMGDLAPRDWVARTIDTELKRSGADYVWLDISHRDPDFVRTRFPSIAQACLKFGIDITKEPIPVVPAAHYMCGGVVTNQNAETDIAGLFAAGETACTGLHGANRLASNSLLEAVVFSTRAATSMRAWRTDVSDFPIVPMWDNGRAVDSDEMVVVSHNWDELRRLMWNYVGIVRSDKRLMRAQKRIEVLQQEIQAYYWDFCVTSDLLELRNLATVAHLVLASAQRRRESRGLHYNKDVLYQDSAWAQDSVLRQGQDRAAVFRTDMHTYTKKTVTEGVRVA